jgi:hypothetical protein
VQRSDATYEEWLAKHRSIDRSKKAILIWAFNIAMSVHDKVSIIKEIVRYTIRRNPISPDMSSISPKKPIHQE